MSRADDGKRWGRRFLLLAGLVAIAGAVMLAVSGAMAEPVWADDATEKTGKLEEVVTNILPKGMTTGKIIKLALNIALFGVGAAGVIGLVIAGIMYLTAKDNEQQVATAKKRIFEIVVGLVLWGVLWGSLNWLIPGGLNLDTLDGDATAPEEMTYGKFGLDEEVTGSSSGSTSGTSSSSSSSSATGASGAYKKVDGYGEHDVMCAIGYLADHTDLKLSSESDDKNKNARESAIKGLTTGCSASELGTKPTTEVKAKACNILKSAKTTGETDFLQSASKLIYKAKC